MKLFKLFKLFKARREVILAAESVAASYEPSLKFHYDPDNVHHLRLAVEELWRLERYEESLVP